MLLSVLLADRLEHLVAEEAVLAFDEGAPRLRLDLVLLQQLLSIALLMEGMNFDSTRARLVKRPAE